VAQTALPRHRLQHGAPARAQLGLQVRAIQELAHRRHQLVAAEYLTVEDLAYRLDQHDHLLRGQAEGLLPAALLPRPRRSDQGEVGAGLARRQQVEGATHGPRPHEPALLQRAGRAAGRRVLLAHPDSQAGRRRHLRLDAAEPPDDVHYVDLTHRVE
jgi:hypothetical protein